MLERKLLLLTITAAFSFALPAQSPQDLARMGWEPLSDSLYLVWNLSTDQIKRIAMIEDDYEVERTALVSDPKLSEAVRDTRLRALANARRKEIKGVLKAEQYEDWQKRTRVEGQH
ncbi:MAG: hypothetical protein KA175_15170 [Flavobacteriales bacterium]|nr:hypothetical protein [Flavobacteriales bacterium]